MLIVRLHSYLIVIFVNIGLHICVFVYNLYYYIFKYHNLLNFIDIVVVKLIFIFLTVYFSLGPTLPYAIYFISTLCKIIVYFIDFNTTYVLDVSVPQIPTLEIPI